MTRRVGGESSDSDGEYGKRKQKKRKVLKRMVKQGFAFY